MAGDFTVSRIRGMNDNEDPAALPDDICVLARNVEWIVSQLGERRRGTAAITLPTSITAHEDVPFLARHLPTGDQSDAELFVLGTTEDTSSTLAYKNTVWVDVIPIDAITLTDGGKYAVRAQTLRQKLFVAYDSGVDRLHVWDGTDFRRVGLAEPPAAPTAVDTASGGSYTGTRYFRVRWTKQVASVTVLRSEPSETLTFEPVGNKTGATITQPSVVDIDDGVTHWELEASVGDGNFYVAATTAIATTTVTDTTAFSPGYAEEFDLSEDVGDYTVPWSAEFLLADEDRLLFLGSHEDVALGSRLGWSPVATGPGVGNSERLELDTDPFLDLDPGVGGKATAHSQPVNGVFYVFKRKRIYRLVRSGKRAKAYEAFLITDTRGALPGSVANGIDQEGRPCVYFGDPEVGPCRLGVDGLKKCGEDIFTTWETVNIDATVPARTEFYAGPDQWHLWVATEDSDTPNLRLMLQTSECQEKEDGVRGGWAVWPGESGEVLATCLFADNIETDEARSHRLVPFIGKTGDGFVQQTDTGTDDNGEAYDARVRTRGYAFGSLLTKAGVMAGAVLTAAAEGVSLLVSVLRDFGAETTSTATAELSPVGDETHVVVKLDNLIGSELTVAQFEFGDEEVPSGQWSLDAFVANIRKEQK